MSQPPAPRYRVVEDGRRLVVIDNWAEDGRPLSVTRGGPESAPADRPSVWGVAKETSFDGRATIVTHAFYDDHGPRTIRLEPSSAHLTKLARWGILGATAIVVGVILISPWLLLPLGFVAFQSFNKIRAAITRWLDAVERDTG